MPELPEVETVRRELLPALAGVRIAHVDVRRAGLRRPFPRHFADRLTGATPTALTRRGKFIQVALSTDETLVIHLGMSGAFRIVTPDAPDEDRELRYTHDHVVLTMADGALVVYNDPRRFGVLDLVKAGGLARYAPLSTLGPEPLDAGFDGAALAAACAGKRTPIKVALLDQRVVAGVGNIYASEALHHARISPRRRAGALATPRGAPREAAHVLAGSIKHVLALAIARHERAYRRSPFLVYEREGAACPRRRCEGVIRRITQAGRSTYYCPVCQR